MFIVGTGVGGMNIAVQKKINKTKSSMSKETYRMQQSLTFILLEQVLEPRPVFAPQLILSGHYPRCFCSYSHYNLSSSHVILPR